MKFVALSDTYLPAALMKRELAVLEEVGVEKTPVINGVRPVLDAG